MPAVARITPRGRRRRWRREVPRSLQVRHEYSLSPIAADGGEDWGEGAYVPVVRQGSAMTPLAATNDFVVKFANINGSGSASANELFAKCILRMGVPVSPRNIFPSNIQGLPKI